MEITDLIWLDAVVDKIETKRRVTPTEVKTPWQADRRSKGCKEDASRAKMYTELWDRQQPGDTLPYSSSTSTQVQYSF
jgi:hypothetical protein